MSEVLVRRWLALSIAILVVVNAAFSARADSVVLDAPVLYERCVTQGVRLASDGAAIELATGVLIEDDGPAAGYSYLPNTEKLAAGKLLRKQLVVDRPHARAATLLVARGGELDIRLNGRPLAAKGPRKLGNYWQAYDFEPKLLSRGENEVILSGSGAVWIARDDEYAAGSLTRRSHPNRSARSTDGGKTWRDAKLGDEDNVDGEYYVRLFLEQHHTRGTLRTPVLDVANLKARPVGPPVEALGEVTIAVDLGSSDPSAACGIRFRSGDAISLDGWREAAVGADGRAKIDDLRGRYVQLEIELKTDDPLTSPRLRELRIESSPELANDWTSRIKTIAADNPPLVRTSIPFVYEDSDHPLLAKLRRDYKLDEVVAGAKTEFEIITRLAAWASQRWTKGHLSESYPPWNALEILEPHADGTCVGGFCHQFNLVFLQACQSFGIPGRAVSIGPGNMTDRIRSGHEVVEIWSNDHAKWVYVDGNAAWYISDAKTGEPLSLWELRQEQLSAFAGRPTRPLQPVVLAPTRFEWQGIDAWPPVVELRLVPRSDFLSRTAPLPLHQGMRGWFWTGYHVWSDEREPAREIYAHRVVKRGNWEWTLNRVHIRLEATKEPGVLRVHLEAVTPNFDAFMAALDDKAGEPIESPFTWRLQPGRNTLKVYTRNKSDRQGPPSHIKGVFE